MASRVSSSKEMQEQSNVVKSTDSGTQCHGAAGMNVKDHFSQKYNITQKFGSLSLNPNAEEFIPSALQSGNSYPGSSLVTQSKKDNSGKKSLDRSGSAKSNGSDDERRRYWRFQLPDDLITDFDFSANNVLEENASCNDSYSANLEGYDDQSADFGLDTIQCSSVKQAIEGDYSLHSDFLAPHERFSSAQSSLSNFLPLGPMSSSAYGLSSGRVLSTEQLLISQGDAQYPFGGDAESDYQSKFVEQQAYNGLGDMQLNLLAAEFPNFAVESLAEILYANQGDLMLTIEMLTQLEIQEGVSQQQTPGTPAAPSLSTVDFPALSGFELANGVSQTADAGIQPNGRHGLTEFSNLFAPSQGSRVGAADFAAIVRKNAQQNTSAWRFGKNSGSTFSGPSVKSVQNARNGDAASRLAAEPFSNTSFGDLERLEGQPWLETGDAVGCIYSDMREEARDHARVRNAYFEQARQAYLVGNKALAKELSAKGQYHNEQMKAAHSRAGEAIFRQRNASRNSTHSNRQGQSRLLDLHGLHVNEAILLLKRELAALRVSARTASKRQQVFICVGTGHHTKGSRTPARLPAAVEQYLLEDERLPFTETEPGMLRVVI